MIRKRITFGARLLAGEYLCARKVDLQCRFKLIEVCSTPEKGKPPEGGFPYTQVQILLRKTRVSPIARPSGFGRACPGARTRSVRR
jgi:hypothetical protein